jgi:hypothetical protein
MNEKIKELMLASDYAAPEIALRAQKLVEQVIVSFSHQLVNNHAVDIPKVIQCAKQYGIDL